MYALLCGFLPFEDEDTTCLYKKILRGKYAKPEVLQDGSLDLIENILQGDPDIRYRMKNIENHRWFKSHQPICEN